MKNLLPNSSPSAIYFFQDFVDQKKMYQAEKTLKKLKRFNNYFDKFAPPTSSIDITPETKSNVSVLDFLKRLINEFLKINNRFTMSVQLYFVHSYVLT